MAGQASWQGLIGDGARNLRPAATIRGMRSKDPRDRRTAQPDVSQAPPVTRTGDTGDQTGDHTGEPTRVPVTRTDVTGPASEEEIPPIDLPGYTMGEVLGRGGMGEVVLAHDEEIGREVAIKRMRWAEPGLDAETRFLREAKIQARLQHPGIVPVHELGVDADGRPYFTMKRLAGTTLYALLGEPLQRL